MKIKSKDIIILVACTALIIGSVSYILKSLKPKTKTVNTVEEAIKKEIPPRLQDKVDEQTLEKVKSLTDYGKPTLKNIGKSNPFGPLQ